MGIKLERVQTLSLSANLQSVYKTNGVGVMARQWRLLSSADRLTDGVLQLSSAITLRPLQGASTLLKSVSERANLKELHERRASF